MERPKVPIPRINSNSNYYLNYNITTDTMPRRKLDLEEKRARNAARQRKWRERKKAARQQQASEEAATQRNTPKPEDAPSNKVARGDTVDQPDGPSKVSTPKQDREAAQEDITMKEDAKSADTQDHRRQEDRKEQWGWATPSQMKQRFYDSVSTLFGRKTEAAT